MPSIDWNRSWAKNLMHHMRGGIKGAYYGDQWGDPNERADLAAIRSRFLEPFVAGNKVALEIGSGGGRWTQYLLPCREVICVEMNPEMFGYIKDRFNNPRNLTYVVTHDSDLPLVPESYVDFVFTFGVFVHLDFQIIEQYIKSLSYVTKAGADVICQFSNKRKPLARDNPDFSENDPERMRQLFAQTGFEVVDIDDLTLEHSTVIHVRNIKKKNN